MASRRRAAGSLLAQETRRRLSLLASILFFAAIAGLGALQLAKDGSLYIDEASVARSLLELPPADLLGRLLGGQSFPRWLLLAVAGLVEIFGYETPVLRALPQLFFFAGSFAWLLLIYERFRDSPALVLLAGGLLMIPACWFVYGAMLKPYTFDVCLAMLPFALRDRFFDDALGRGQSTRRVLALALPCALSYPYVGALLARAGGWWLARAATGTTAVSTRAALALLGGCAVFLLALWQTDLRHTTDLGEPLRGFWASCILGSGSASALDLLDRFGVGWWSGRSELALAGGVGPPTLVLLRFGVVAGLARIALSSSASGRDSAPDAWGSRSLGCALLVLGVPVASVLLGYPICAGRLTLFALLPLLIVTLEGIALVAGELRRLPGGAWIARVAGAVLIAAVAPAAWTSAAALVASAPPEDLRPLLARTRERPELPILSTACTRRQIETLPEGAPAPVRYLGEGGAAEVLRLGRREVFVLYVPATYCDAAIEKLRETALAWKPLQGERDTARLVLAQLGAGTAALDSR